jgi:adenosine kinase
MSILVTGSLAIDRIMVFPDRFKNHILPDKLHILSVSFHVPEMREFFGGCAGNIAYGLKLLGADPLIMASAGRDFGAYAEWLDRHGIRRDGIQIHDDAHTAQCFITTDLDDNQIVAFHPGAMERASELRVEERSDEISLAIVGPDDNAAMRKHAAALKQKGVPTVIDPGQQLINFDPDGLLTFLEGAHVFVANDYEWAVTLERTGIAEDELARRAGAIIVTRGAKGSTILQAGRRTEVPPAAAERVVDPTGCGDAYRAGLLYGLDLGLPLEAAARIGSLMGSLAVEERGTQSVRIDAAGIHARYEKAFGERFPVLH